MLETLPGLQATMIEPRLLGAYGALVAAATLGVLYLYRGRAFIVYWIGAWLLLAAGLVIASDRNVDPRLAGVLLGLAVRLTIWAGGLLFPRWNRFPRPRCDGRCRCGSWRPPPSGFSPLRSSFR